MEQNLLIYRFFDSILFFVFQKNFYDDFFYSVLKNPIRLLFRHCTERISILK